MRLDDLFASSWTPHRLRIFHQHSEPGRVLDYGCYNGYITRLLAERGWEGWGIDSNREFIQLAEDLTRQQGMQECCHFSQVAVDATATLLSCGSET